MAYRQTVPPYHHLDFSPNCPDSVIVRFIDDEPSPDKATRDLCIDYTHCGSFDAAVRTVIDEWWEPGYILEPAGTEISWERAYEMSARTLQEFSRDEVMQAAIEGEDWPFSLALVEDKDA